VKSLRRLSSKRWFSFLSVLATKCLLTNLAENFNFMLTIEVEDLELVLFTNRAGQNHLNPP
jgi:hypothetical protein